MHRKGGEFFAAISFRKPYSFFASIFRIFPDGTRSAEMSSRVQTLAGKRGSGFMQYEPISLRMEAADGSATEEYRIRESNIEVRTLKTPRSEDEHCGEWQRLTPKELTEHVQRKPALSQWLQRRIGWRRVLLACTEQEVLHELGYASAAPQQHAA